MPQVAREHYLSDVYLCKERFLQLREQLLQILKLQVHSVLEIGPGPGLLSPLVKQCGMDCTTVDFADDLKPDIVSDITDIPIENASYDLVCAFQVLEHLTWDRMQRALKEMERATRAWVVISVPDHAQLRTARLDISLAVWGKQLRFRWTRPSFHGISNPQEHCWEIGAEGITAEDVRQAAAEAGLQCAKDWIDGSHYFIFHKIQ